MRDCIEPMSVRSSALRGMFRWTTSTAWLRRLESILSICSRRSRRGTEVELLASNGENVMRGTLAEVERLREALAGFATAIPRRPPAAGVLLTVLHAPLDCPVFSTLPAMQYPLRWKVCNELRPALAKILL